MANGAHTEIINYVKKLFEMTILKERKLKMLVFYFVVTPYLKPYHYFMMTLRSFCNALDSRSYTSGKFRRL